MMQRLFAILAALMLTATAAVANEFHKPDVLDLKGKSFDEKVRADAEPAQRRCTALRLPDPHSGHLSLTTPAICRSMTEVYTSSSSTRRGAVSSNKIIAFPVIPLSSRARCAA